MRELLYRFSIILNAISLVLYGIFSISEIYTIDPVCFNSFKFLFSLGILFITKVLELIIVFRRRKGR